MKVPYAKKWWNETDELRKIVLDCDYRARASTAFRRLDGASTE
jgi:hypothetical protein